MTALLTDNLPLLAGAPNGIKKLRELILELAVRGKLVPQDPSDEPASELLKRIAEEKARLVAEGKIKKQKPLADINADGVPFEIPVTWEWARLGEITNFGITVKKEEIPEDAWVLDLEDIEKDTSKLLQKACLKERNSLSDKNIFTKGDVLYGKLRPYLNKVLVADEDGFCTTEILPFRCYGPFVAHYFMGALKSPYFLSYVNARSYGMKMPRLGTEDGRQAFFPLPPLAEQHRIVAKVDELMALCDRLDARQADADSAHAQLVQALLGSLTQARDAEDFAQSWQRLAEHFHTLFTTESSIDDLKQTLLQLAVMGKLVPQDPDDGPASELLGRNGIESEPHELHGWAKTQLGKLGNIFGGSTPNKASGKFWGGDIPWVSPKDMKRPVIHDSEDHVSAKALEETSLKTVPQNSLLMVVRGMILAHSFPVAITARDVTINQDMKALVPPKEICTYLLMYLQAVKSVMVRLVDRSSHGTCKLISEKLWTHAVSLPPLAEQHRIVARVDQLMALCDQLKARLGEARQVHGNLANALIGQALSGEKQSRAEVVDFSAYLISKLASRRTFGRVAHMKLLFLADSLLGLGLMDGYRRHAAGPLDTTIYRVEELAAQEGLYSTSIEVLKSGQEKVSYHIGDNISRSVGVAAAALGAGRKELDRLIALFEGRKTDDLEVVATLYSVWNDALAGGLDPNDEWLINEFRSNWHEAKERFTPDILGKWLGWMRDNGLVPTGNSAVTKSQAAFLFN
ncbi:restriction endonuclease subunit S [Xanthomonas campestris]|uniref:restriction endonuclease subunit S n=1 Tax=Xanthomonas campestris TaxID=339 RepID=UPI002B221EAC|nr:restriction endonuclease subunit S [Xanthomonas campestris]MEA9765523.1 restriction endonuclease subunit S [Xanthomonas campestris pv. raphani]MEA9817837.1 restriction endonuclease subunit S [Xanthomonas campestris pv. raphani]MEA9911036.1 restriction endonuclease subunit S [Xanthomonas campestris pv. raphani]MEA9927311.1 restriction endonuclease subunit S [Xanthomonas campestris pv. raphani]MEA9939503.1 restriction endonuclease subunit S [Xanthomonas campestris pv. raphani]